MGKVFEYDNPVWVALGKVADIIYLSILWMICSLPIFTIGASTAALYEAIKCLHNEEGKLTSAFFRTFSHSFKKSTMLWSIFFIVGFVLSVDLYFFHQIQSDLGKILFIASLILSIVVSMTFMMSFILLSYTDKSVRETLAEAFYMSIRTLPISAGMLSGTVMLILLILFKYWFIILIAPGLIAYFHIWVFSNFQLKYSSLQK